MALHFFHSSDEIKNQKCQMIDVKNSLWVFFRVYEIRTERVRAMVTVYFENYLKKMKSAHDLL